MANNCKQCFNTHYQPHCHPTTKSLWLCSSVYCGPPHPSRRIMVGGRSRQPKTWLDCDDSIVWDKASFNISRSYLSRLATVYGEPLHGSVGIVCLLFSAYGRRGMRGVQSSPPGSWPRPSLLTHLEGAGDPGWLTRPQGLQQATGFIVN